MGQKRYGNSIDSPVVCSNVPMADVTTAFHVRHQSNT